MSKMSKHLYSAKSNNEYVVHQCQESHRTRRSGIEVQMSSKKYVKAVGGQAAEQIHQ